LYLKKSHSFFLFFCFFFFSPIVSREKWDIFRLLTTNS
jgi:hypothetical protein